jgi:predicted RNase H-like HicB family nuclease
VKSPKKSTHSFQVIIEQDEAGWYVAECPALKACYTQGKTYEGAIAHIKDVIAMCLADFKANGQPLPEQPEIISVRRVEVSV